jgi:mannosyltransferase
MTEAGPAALKAQPHSASQLETRTASISQGVARPRLWIASSALMAGICGIATSNVGTWNLALWYDESATVSAADRSVADLGRLVQNVDAVHAVYYFVMHFWIRVFGSSELSLRMPSALAVGLTCALIAMMGWKMGQPRVGLAAAFITASLPRVFWAGSEGRLYAATALTTVLVLWSVLRLWRSGRRVDGLLLSVSIGVAVHLFLFSVLLVPALIVAAMLLRRRSALTALYAGIGVLVSIPFVLVSTSQGGQVAWIRAVPWDKVLTEALPTQWFSGQGRPRNWEFPDWVMPYSQALAVIAVLLMAAALLGSRTNLKLRPWVVLSASVATVPTSVLLIVSALSTPYYVPRYLTFTAPAIAILVAAGISVVSRNSRGFVVSTLIFCTMGNVMQIPIKDYLPRAYDFAQVASSVESSRWWSGSVAFENDEARAVAAAYPTAFRDLHDVSTRVGPAESATLFGLPNTPEAVAGVGRMVFVADHQLGNRALETFLRSRCSVHPSPAGLQGEVILFDCTRAR